MDKEELLRKIEGAAKSGALSLDLAALGLTELPIEIGNLTDLRSLSLGNNSLTSLPPEIGNLTNLRRLSLSNEGLNSGNNSLTSLPPEIGNLTNLRMLFLHANSLTSLPPEIGNLTNLSTLFLHANSLTSLPPEIGNLTNLSRLYLNENSLTLLPPEIGNLTNLNILRLDNNSLTSVPPEIGKLTKLNELDLRNNSLPIPPEILKDIRSPDRIVNYYLEFLAAEQTSPLNEAKMLIVGQGGVGKTSLVNRLIHDDFNPDENKTEGIDIQRWTVNADGTDVQLNVWDFGGQEIMHATHQFFLTKRSLYVLVLDARQGEAESRIEYWLKLIQSFGGDAPIIVVSNKSDQHDLDLDWTGLQRKYPSIKHFAKKVSCESGEGIKELRTVIERKVSQLEHIHDELPSNWFKIKTQLEKMDEDSISYERYQELCEAQGIENELSQSSLVSLLHDLGVVLHFHDHPILGSTNILNPEWVTGGVYQILNSHQLFEEKGKLDISDLRQVLKPRRRYPRNKHLVVTSMMQQFELCFDFPDAPNERFLVPDLLPRDEPYTGDWKESLEFEYHYDVLPTSIISRFIVRMNAYISKNTYWRNGVVLQSENGENMALVRADHEDKKIFIHVRGNENSRRRFLEVIRSDLHRIHATISRMESKGMVAIPGHAEAPPVAYDYLLELEGIGEETFVPQGVGEKIKVSQLLDGVESSAWRTQMKAERNSQINIRVGRIEMSQREGDTYNVKAEQIGAVGPNATVRGNTFTQTWSEIETSIELPTLVNELQKLRETLKDEASDGEHYAAIAAVVDAEKAAEAGNGSGVLEHLSKAGRWTLGVAERIGVPVAVEALKSVVG